VRETARRDLCGGTGVTRPPTATQPFSAVGVQYRHKIPYTYQTVSETKPGSSGSNPRRRGNQAAERHSEKLHDLRSSEPSSQHDGSLSIDTVNLKNCFAWSGSIVLTCMADGSFRVLVTALAPLARTCRSGAVH
jgi:hypothetical protein